MHEAFEHLISVLLVTIMFGYSAQTISRVNNLSAGQANEMDMWRGQLASLVLEEYLSSPSGETDLDKLASLSRTYALSGGPYESNYTYLVATKLGLPDINFNLRIKTALQVTLRRVGEQIQVNVTQSSSRTPVQALVKLYVFNGTAVVGTYLGETAISGYLNFDVTILGGSVVVAFASSGSSVGYAVMDERGAFLSPSRDKGYVKASKLENNTSSNKIILALEDWTVVPQSNLIEVGGFSLPILILWKSGTTYSFIEYPHLPDDYGAPVPTVLRREYKIVTIICLGNNTFIWDARVWRG